MTRNLLCQAAHGFVHKPHSRSFTNSELSEGFRNNIAQVCKILELNLFDISLRVAPGKLETVTTCGRFIRAFVASCPDQW